jgi:hypothetical protein
VKAATTYYDIKKNAQVQKAIPAHAHLCSMNGPCSMINRGLHLRSLWLQ